MAHFLFFFLLLVHFYIVSISRWKFNVDTVAHNRTECDGFVFIFYSCCVWFHLMCSLFSQLSHCSMWVVRRLTSVRHSAVFFSNSIWYCMSWWRVNATGCFCYWITQTHASSFVHLLNWAITRQYLFSFGRLALHCQYCYCIRNVFLIHVMWTHEKKEAANITMSVNVYKVKSKTQWSTVRNVPCSMFDAIASAMCSIVAGSSIHYGCECVHTFGPIFHERFSLHRVVNCVYSLQPYAFPLGRAPYLCLALRPCTQTACIFRSSHEQQHS